MQPSGLFADLTHRMQNRLPSWLERRLPFAHTSTSPLSK